MHWQGRLGFLEFASNTLMMMAFDFLECMGGWVGILVMEETDNLECMKKSTIVGGNKYILDYERGCLTTALRDCCWRNG